MHGSRPRILVLTSDRPRHDHFALSVIDCFRGALDVRIVRQRKPDPILRRPGRLCRLARVRRAAQLRNMLLNTVFARHNARLFRHKARVEEVFFASSAQSAVDRCAPDTLGVFADVNDPDCVSLVARYRPDVTAVMGTTLIRKPLMAACGGFILNIHTGLSPYYRGGMTNLFPIINREPQYCGVTVHELDPGIDSGPIVHHGLPVVAPSDDFPTLNCKAIEIGCRLMTRAIEDAIANRLESCPQGPGGRLYLARDFHAGVARRYHRLLDGGAVRRDLERLAAGVVARPAGLRVHEVESPAHARRSSV